MPRLACLNRTTMQFGRSDLHRTVQGFETLLLPRRASFTSFTLGPPSYCFLLDQPTVLQEHSIMRTEFVALPYNLNRARMVASYVRLRNGEMTGQTNTNCIRTSKFFYNFCAMNEAEHEHQGHQQTRLQ